MPEVSFLLQNMVKQGKEEQQKGLPFGLIIFIYSLLYAMFQEDQEDRTIRISATRGLPLWMLLSMMNSGRGSHSGSWGGFSGGGGGGGGFGGFGGGSFGGGGAGGSW